MSKKDQETTIGHVVRTRFLRHRKATVAWADEPITEHIVQIVNILNGEVWLELDGRDGHGDWSLFIPEGTSATITGEKPRKLVFTHERKLVQIEI